MKISKETTYNLTKEDKEVLMHYIKTGKLMENIFDLYASEVKNDS